ncbi:15600_t:CDS:10 [Funneliformis geosporum]|uniref:15600_t:CDS:1 n=1 Tax=Funneliformis geosporum TaxID=1117311 RepID=A0A9W4SCN7_9GLOM|nr:15600_t:CDS:10 [Funneliformis geosporum]
MKFGKTLLKNHIPEWSRHYISYKALKKFINNTVKTTSRGGTTVDDDSVVAFFFTLDSELEKVNNFFLYKCAEIERRLRILSEKYRPSLNSSSIDFNSIDHGSNVHSFDPYADTELLSVLMETKDKVHKLLYFADLNIKGFSKILKKFDKKLGRDAKCLYLQTKVDKLPFASGSLLIDMLDSNEHWIQEVQRRVTEYEQNPHHDTKSTTKARLLRINLTEEHIKMLSDSLHNDNIDILQNLINLVDSDLKILTSMLYKACYFGAMKCIKLLLESGASIADDYDINERSMIHKLAINGGKLPLDNSSSLTSTSCSPINNGNSSEGQMIYSVTTFQMQNFQSEVVCEDINLISWILEYIPQAEYSNVSSADAFGRRPLHYAAINGFEKITGLLLEFVIRTGQFSLEQGFSDPSWFDNDGFTPLFYAIRRGHTKVVDCIIKGSNMKNIDAISNAADSSPSYGSINSTPTTINPAVSQYVMPSAHVSSYIFSHNRTQTPLATACKFGHIETAKLLLVYCADPDIQDEEGETPLHLAARNGFDDCVRLLVGLDDSTEHQNSRDDLNTNFKKANMEIKEKFYGWTPLFLAAVEGHTECVKVLIEAGADPNVMDYSGWTPHIHAVFRGHYAVKNILCPLTAFEEPNPSPIIANVEINSAISNVASAEFAYGHKYLQDQSLILVTLGNTDTRKNNVPVELYNTSISMMPPTLISLVVSAKNATGEPAIMDLPVNKTVIDPIMFYSSNIDEVILTFDIVPAFGTKKQSIGRACALLSSVKTSSGSQHSSLMGYVTVPILGMGTLEVIGRVIFEFLIVKPFKNENLAVGNKHTYRRSFTTKVIGHRGFGMNRAGTPNLQIGENTLISFITAASLGAEYVEFDVQLTKDHVPVIYHDWTITETGYDIPIHAITLEQFLNLKKQKTVNNQKSDELLLNRREFSFNPSSISEQNHKKLKRSNSVGSVTSLAYSEHMGKLKGNSDGSIQVKYPMIDEAEADDLPSYHTELNLFVDTILQCVYDNAQDRNIIFSSFHPDICLMLAFKQPNYPVFFLSDCGETTLADARCNSIQAAIRFAKYADLLGIVSNSAPIIEAPKLVATIKEAGLLLFTYGTMNNEVGNVQLQRKAGVDAVIVDSVLAVRKGLQQIQS